MQQNKHESGSFPESEKKKSIWKNTKQKNDPWRLLMPDDLGFKSNGPQVNQRLRSVCTKKYKDGREGNDTLKELTKHRGNKKHICSTITIELGGTAG